jgi:hypothetical protein
MAEAVVSDGQQHDGQGGEEAADGGRHNGQAH